MNGSQFELLSELDLTSQCVDGNRIRLRSICEHYADAIYEGFSDDITQFMVPKPAQVIDDTLNFIRESVAGMKSKSDLVFVVMRREDEEFLGCCGVHPRGASRTPELGIWIKKEAHGQRYGSEAIALACQWALRNIAFEYLVYPVDRNNLPSRRIPESMGGEIFQERREPTMRGTELDEVVFKLTPETIKKTISRTRRGR